MKSRERGCLILLNGELGPAAPVRRAARISRGILCCDGAARHAAALGLQPDFVVGDMDSVPHPLPKFKKAVYWCDFDPNRCDLDKALELAVRLGCRRAYVAGALGGRLDHSLVNLAVLESFRGPLEFVLLGEGRGELVGPGRRAVPARRGQAFSLLAAPRAVVTVTGARYPLERAALSAGSRGLSNVALSAPEVTVHEGRVWVLTPG